MSNKPLIKKEKEDQKVIYIAIMLEIPKWVEVMSCELWHKDEKENTVSGKWMIAST